MKLLIFFFILTFTATVITAVSAAKISSHETTFGPGGRYSGYLVRPSGRGPFPGLVVVHEWWGLNDQIKGEARNLAGQGYVALAVDLFGKVAKTPQEAMKLVGGLDQKKATTELLAAADHLRSLRYVRPERIGSIGWCFGGGQSLNLAINDPKLAAAVIYYGQPVTDQKQLAKIKAPLLLIYGEADKSIRLEKVKEFDRALTRAGVKHELHTYPGAGHAFANPTRADAFKPQAAADAWKKTMAFLGRHLKGRS